VSRQIAVLGAALTGSSVLLAALLLPTHAIGMPVCDAFGAPALPLMAGGAASV
jgi:hypothetical protein